MPADGHAPAATRTLTAASAAGSPPLRASAAVAGFVLSLFAFLPFVAGDGGLAVFEGLELGFHPGLLFFLGVGGALVGALAIAQVRSLTARDPLDHAAVSVSLFAVAIGAFDFLLYFLLIVTG